MKWDRDLIYKTNFLSFILLLLSSLGLVSCSSSTPLDIARTTTQVPTDLTPEAKEVGFPTPIPNPRAEVILTYNFGGFVNHLKGRDLTISQNELALLLKYKAPFLVDLRKPLEVKKTGYIPGAILIPLSELGRKSSALPDYKVPVIVYCQKTSECMIALTGLGVFGWEIKVLDGGFEAWAAAGQPVKYDQIPVPTIDPFKPAFPCCGIYQQSAEVKANPNAPSASLVAATDRMFDHIPENFGAITVEELEQEILADSSLVVIDLRPSSMLKENQPIKAPNFLNIPFESLIEKRELWPKDKATPIIVYCQDGTVSPVAMTIFWTWGYQNTRELQGGIAAWAK